MLKDGGAIVAILGILAGLMISLRWYQRRFSPHPELVRKLLHVSMGLITLAFPWLFRSALSVVVLAVLATGWLLALRFYPPLQQRLGSVLNQVERRSLGEIYFVVSVALLFWFSQGQALLFWIPMLILTLADAIAALIGIRYGQLHYTTTEGQKSAEGSISFFTMAFFSVHIPLLLASNTGRAETLLIALILALLVMVLEAIAWQGLDNLFIPLGGLILLKTHLGMSVTDLLIRLVLTVMLVSFVLCWRNRTTLNDSALLGAALMGYLSWTLGGWHWLLPPLIFLIAYPWFVPWVDQQKTPLTPAEQQFMRWLPTQPTAQPRQWERVHTVSAVLSVYAAGGLWLVLFGLFDRPTFFYLYILSFAANLALVGVAGISPSDYWQLARLRTLFSSILKAWLLFTPYGLVVGLSQRSIQSLLICGVVELLGIGMVAIAFYLTQPLLRQKPERLAWFSRVLWTTLGTLLLWPVLLH